MLLAVFAFTVHLIESIDVFVNETIDSNSNGKNFGEGKEGFQYKKIQTVIRTPNTVTITGSTCPTGWGKGLTSQSTDGYVFDKCNYKGLSVTAGTYAEMVGNGATSFILTECNFEDIYGRVLAAGGLTATVERCIFENVRYDGFGQVIYTTYGGLFQLDRCIFRKCGGSSSYASGIVYVGQRAVSIITETRFYSCTAPGNMIIFTNPPLDGSLSIRMDNNEFANNTVTTARYAFVTISGTAGGFVTSFSDNRFCGGSASHVIRFTSSTGGYQTSDNTISKSCVSAALGLACNIGWCCSDTLTCLDSALTYPLPTCDPADDQNGCHPPGLTCALHIPAGDVPQCKPSTPPSHPCAGRVVSRTLRKAQRKAKN